MSPIRGLVVTMFLSLGIPMYAMAVSDDERYYEDLNTSVEQFMQQREQNRHRLLTFFERMPEDIMRFKNRYGHLLFAGTIGYLLGKTALVVIDMNRMGQ